MKEKKSEQDTKGNRHTDTHRHTDTRTERKKRDLVSLPLSQVHSVRVIPPLYVMSITLDIKIKFFFFN